MMELFEGACTVVRLFQDNKVKWSLKKWLYHGTFVGNSEAMRYETHLTLFQSETQGSMAVASLNTFWDMTIVYYSMERNTTRIDFC